MNPNIAFNSALKAVPCPHKGVLIEFGRDNDAHFVSLSMSNLHDFPEGKREDIVLWVLNFCKYMTETQKVVTFFKIE